jgi:hypothetical protein
MRCGTWKARGLYKAVAVEEFRWVVGDSQPAQDYTFFYGNGNFNRHVHKGMTLAGKEVEFISDRMLITLRGRRCDIIFLNVHALTEHKSDVMKESIYRN